MSEDALQGKDKWWLRLMGVVYAFLIAFVFLYIASLMIEKLAFFCDGILLISGESVDTIEQARNACNATWFRTLLIQLAPVGGAMAGIGYLFWILLRRAIVAMFDNKHN